MWQGIEPNSAKTNKAKHLAHQTRVGQIKWKSMNFRVLQCNAGNFVEHKLGRITAVHTMLAKKLPGFCFFNPTHAPPIAHVWLATPHGCAATACHNHIVEHVPMGAYS